MMNNQEAIRILGDTNLCSPLGQAAFVGIEAIKKQIPKNVIIENGWKYCPACYECINDDYGTETNYCSDCGQRLEW